MSGELIDSEKSSKILDGNMQVLRAEIIQLRLIAKEQHEALVQIFVSVGGVISEPLYSKIENSIDKYVSLNAK